MKYFGTITIFEKGAGDYRACVLCRYNGVLWELRAQGSTPEEACKEAFSKYNEPYKSWKFHGYKIPEYII